MNDIPKTIPALFVFAGIRAAKQGKAVAILQLDEAKQIVGEERLFLFSRGMSKILGGIYEGASFSETHASGIASAKYVEQWPNREDVFRWKALEESDLLAIAREAALKKLASKSEFADFLIPLRVQYQKLMDRGDYREAEAFIQAINLALRKRVPK